MSTANDWSTANDDFAMDGTGVDGDSLQSGDFIDREGWYHFEVSDVADKFGEGTPHLRFNMLVLHSVEGQSPKGSAYGHRMYLKGSNGGPLKEGSKEANLRMGLGLGVLKNAVIDGQACIVDAATGSPKITPDTYRRAKGRQCIAKIVAEKSDDPKFGDKFVVQFGRFYAVDDPAVASVPKCQRSLTLIGKGPKSNTSNVGAGATASEAPSQKPAEQPPQAATNAPDEFDGLDV